MPACCLPSGCQPAATADDCPEGGVFIAGEECGPDNEPCTSTLGGCCLNAGGGFQCEDLEIGTCFSFGGEPNLLPCAAITCGEPTGACCFYGEGGCAELTAEACGKADGAYQGDGTLCPQACNVLGACCEPFEECNDRDFTECANAGGNWQGPGTTCAEIDCPDIGCRGPLPDFWPAGDKLHSRDRCEPAILAMGRRPAAHRTPTTLAPENTWEPATVMPKRNSQVDPGDEECRIQYGVRGVTPWGWVYPYLCSKVRVGLNTEFHWHRGVFAVFAADQVQAPISRGWSAMVASAENPEDFELMLRSEARICGGPEQ